MFSFIDCVCECGEHTGRSECLWRAEGSLGESVFPFRWDLGPNSGHRGLFGVSWWDIVGESVGFCKSPLQASVPWSYPPLSKAWFFTWVFQHWPSGPCVILSMKESWSPHRGYFLVFGNWNRELAWTHSQRGCWHSSHVDAWCVRDTCLKTGFLCLVCRVLTVTCSKQSRWCSC